MVRASIEICARVDEALHRWSEFSVLVKRRVAPVLSDQAIVSRVDFEPLAGARSRVTLELEQRGDLAEPASARRVLEDHLNAFEGFVGERGMLRCGSARS